VDKVLLVSSYGINQEDLEIFQEIASLNGYKLIDIYNPNLTYFWSQTFFKLDEKDQKMMVLCLAHMFGNRSYELTQHCFSDLLKTGSLNSWPKWYLEIEKELKHYDKDSLNTLKYSLSSVREKELDIKLTLFKNLIEKSAIENILANLDKDSNIVLCNINLSILSALVKPQEIHKHKNFVEFHAYTTSAHRLKIISLDTSIKINYEITLLSAFELINSIQDLSSNIEKKILATNTPESFRDLVLSETSSHVSSTLSLS